MANHKAWFIQLKVIVSVGLTLIPSLLLSSEKLGPQKKSVPSKRSPINKKNFTLNIKEINDFVATIQDKEPTPQNQQDITDLFLAIDVETKAPHCKRELALIREDFNSRVDARTCRLGTMVQKIKHAVATISAGQKLYPDQTTMITRNTLN